MNRRTISLLIAILGILSVPLIFTLSAYLTTQAIAPEPIGGIYRPLELEAPTLYPIDPLIDNDGDIMLDWFDVNGATFYEIYRRDNGTTFSLIKPRVVDSMYLDIGLSDGYYDYYIIASNGVGISNPSETKTVQVLIPLPIAPTLRTIWPAVSKTGDISLEWRGCANSYNVYRAKESESFTLIESDISSREYLDEVLSDGNYQYYVTAVVNQKESEPSNINAVQISLEQESTSPDAPPENDNFAMIILSFVVCIGIILVCLIIRIKR